MEGEEFVMVYSYNYLEVLKVKAGMPSKVARADIKGIYNMVHAENGTFFGSKGA